LPRSIIEREAKISDFLNKIGQSKSDYSGALIDRIFIPPDEYDEIKEKLRNDRIVFITGTAGYGKTYIAIRLLWEWYNEGYTPRWISGGSKEEREEVGKRLANIDAELKEKHIIYFEDPFGKTKYERRDDLRERINHIINSVRNKKDVFVVITSRKDVFEEFEKESYSVEEIKEFEKELNILKPSYDYEKRKEILEKWAEEKGCEWFNDENLKNVVFESLKNDRTLATPLSIHDFVEATIKVNNEKELRRKIDSYSQEVEIAFADEIKGLYESGRKDRVLFLSFIFVSEFFEVDFVKQEYEKLKEEDFEDFENILKEEYRIKIGKDWKGRTILEFSHPSYSGAIYHLLDNSGCKRIFCKVLKELAEKESVAMYVAWTVAKNFEKLPEDVRNLLFKLAEGESTAWAVAQAVVYNFEKLPENVRNLLFKLAEKKSTAWYIAYAIAINFEKLPNEVQNLLDKLQKELILVIKKLSESKHYLERIEAIGLIRNTKTKINKKFAVEILTKLSKDEHEMVRKAATSALKQFQ